jgi:hypothetical protein
MFESCYIQMKSSQWKIDIISFVIKFHSQQAFTLNFIHRSRHKTDMDVVPFLNLMGYMQ